MPEIDGFEFAKTVRELNQEIPLPVYDSQDDFASKQRGFKMGIDDYMVKPIDLDELLLRVKPCCAGLKLLRAKRLTVGSLTLDTEEHTAYLNHEEIP